MRASARCGAPTLDWPGGAAKGKGRGGAGSVGVSAGERGSRRRAVAGLQCAWARKEARGRGRKQERRRVRLPCIRQQRLQSTTPVVLPQVPPPTPHSGRLCPAAPQLRCLIPRPAHPPASAQAVVQCRPTHAAAVRPLRAAQFLLPLRQPQPSPQPQPRAPADDADYPRGAEGPSAVTNANTLNSGIGKFAHLPHTVPAPKMLSTYNFIRIVGFVEFHQTSVLGVFWFEFFSSSA
jgi:hypothetical protein